MRAIFVARLVEWVGFCRANRLDGFQPMYSSMFAQLGHQAAQCTSGTVNWRQIYGDSAFILRPPVFWSEEQAAKKAKQADLQALEKAAREYAKVNAHSKSKYLSLPGNAASQLQEVI
jgi:hypothetical protein